MPERGADMQQDQAEQQPRGPLVPPLQGIGEVLVRHDQDRQLRPEQMHRLALRIAERPAEQRLRQQQRVQRQVVQRRQPAQQPWRALGGDQTARPETQRHTGEEKREHAQPDVPMSFKQPHAQRAAGDLIAGQYQRRGQQQAEHGEPVQQHQLGGVSWWRFRSVVIGAVAQIVTGIGRTCVAGFRCIPVLPFHNWRSPCA
jgi:hypothetical protein